MVLNESYKDDSKKNILSFVKKVIREEPHLKKQWDHYMSLDEEDLSYEQESAIDIIQSLFKDYGSKSKDVLNYAEETHKWTFVIPVPLGKRYDGCGLSSDEQDLIAKDIEAKAKANWPKAKNVTADTTSLGWDGLKVVRVTIYEGNSNFSLDALVQRAAKIFIKSRGTLFQTIPFKDLRYQGRDQVAFDNNLYLIKCGGPNSSVFATVSYYTEKSDDKSSVRVYLRYNSEEARITYNKNEMEDLTSETIYKDFTDYFRKDYDNGGY